MTLCGGSGCGQLPLQKRLGCGVQRPSGKRRHTRATTRQWLHGDKRRHDDIQRRLRWQPRTSPAANDGVDAGGKKAAGNGRHAMKSGGGSDSGGSGDGDGGRGRQQQANINSGPPLGLQAGPYRQRTKQCLCGAHLLTRRLLQLCSCPCYVYSPCFSRPQVCKASASSPCIHLVLSLGSCEHLCHTRPLSSSFSAEQILLMRVKAVLFVAAARSQLKALGRGTQTR